MNEARAAGSVVVVGSYNRDLSVALDRFPAPGETVIGGALVTAHGGKGSNQAVQAARCGAAVALVAAIGTDAAGAEAEALWRAEGIRACLARRDAVPTGTALILVDAAGENQIAVVPGANATLAPADLPAAALAGAAVVLAQLEVPAEAVRAAFALARGRRVLNVAPATAPLPPALLAAADVVIANAGEAARLSALAPDTAIEALAHGLARVAAPGATVVVTAGAEGALLLAPGAEPVRARPPRVEVVDTTGAGDAFCGAFAAALARGEDAATALARGVQAGALACRARGAVPSFATLA